MSPLDLRRLRAGDTQARCRAHGHDCPTGGAADYMRPLFDRLSRDYWPTRSWIVAPTWEEWRASKAEECSIETAKQRAERELNAPAVDAQVGALLERVRRFRGGDDAA